MDYQQAGAQEKKEYGVYINSMLSKKLALKVTEVGRNIKQNLEKKIKFSIEGKCIAEGFIRPKTVEVISYSCGLIKDDHIEFQVIYRCLVCNPIKDMEVECLVNNVTKAGIHAFVKDDENNIPITIFVARDHHNTNSLFDSVEDNDVVRVKIIGVRFELNDPTITAIASLLEKTGQVKYGRVEEKRQEEERNIKEAEKLYEEKMKLNAKEFEEAEEARLKKEELKIRLEIEEKELMKDVEELPKVNYDEQVINAVKPRKIIIRK